MMVDMADQESGSGGCLNPGCIAIFRGGNGPDGKPVISEDSALGSPCPNVL
jgi:hypothetical protein